MAQTFEMAFGKGAHYSLAIGTVMELLLAALIAPASAVMSLGIVVLTFAMVVLYLLSLSKSSYAITDKTLSANLFAQKRRDYSIDKITHIDFIDIGTEWSRSGPNARHQLAIHFDRKYIKSVLPVYFAPRDREAFVKAIMAINPSVTVDEDEKTI